MKTYLIILALCASNDPASCTTPSTDQATLMQYHRLVDCVRDRERLPPAAREGAVCTGRPFDPWAASRG